VFATFQAGDVDLEDLLGGVFGGRRRRQGPVRGADAEAEMELSVEEAFTGGRRRLTLTGTGGERSYEVNIPPGVTDGQRVRLAGQGGQGQGGQAGDLYLRVHIAPHPRYRLDGRDIYVDLPVTPWEAALGANVPVDGPGGEAKVSVPAGSSSGRRLRLKGRGMPNPKGPSGPSERGGQGPSGPSERGGQGPSGPSERGGGSPGDLYAELKILVPKGLSDRERELFEELGRASDFDPRRQP
jgi:curved DNA-binding protein